MSNTNHFRILSSSVALLLAASAASSSGAIPIWTNGAGDRDYLNAENWSTGEVPDNDDDRVQIDRVGTDSPIFDQIGAFNNPHGISIGSTDATSSGLLTVLNGTISTGEWSFFGLNGGSGRLEVAGGNFLSNSQRVILGAESTTDGEQTTASGTGEIDVSAPKPLDGYNVKVGDLHVGAWSGLSTTVSAGEGTLTMTSGRMLVTSDIHSGGGAFVVGDYGGTGTVTLSGDSELYVQRLSVGGSHLFTGNSLVAARATTASLTLSDSAKLVNGVLGDSSGTTAAEALEDIHIGAGNSVVTVATSGSSMIHAGNKSVIFGADSAEVTVETTGASSIVAIGDLVFGRGNSSVSATLSGTAKWSANNNLSFGESTLSTTIDIIGGQAVSNGGNGLYVGNTPGLTLNDPAHVSTVNISGTGELRSGAGSYFIVAGGDFNNGVINIENGGTVESHGLLYVGQGMGSKGKIVINAGGTLNHQTISVNPEGTLPNITIANGEGSTGEIVQHGGTVTLKDDGGLPNDLVIEGQGTGSYTLNGGVLSVDGSIVQNGGAFSWHGGTITRSNPGAIVFQGSLRTLDDSATFGLDMSSILEERKTFNITGTLDISQGITFHLPNGVIPVGGGEGSFFLGTAGSGLEGSETEFLASTTHLSGLINLGGYTLIDESLAEADSANTIDHLWVTGDNGQIFLHYNAVAIPEPSTAAALFGAVGMLLGLRRFRKV